MKKERRSFAARRPLAATSNEAGAEKSTADVSVALATVATIAVRRAAAAVGATETVRAVSPAAWSSDMATERFTKSKNRGSVGGKLERQ